MKKKALATSRLILLLVVIATLLVISFQAKTFLEGGSYESSLLECNLAFQNIGGKANFFSDSLDTPTLKLEKLLAGTCASKDIKISSQVSNAAKLVEDCYFKAASGKDIMGANTNDIGICLYCGKISSKDEIEFEEKFIEKISEDDYSNLFEEAGSSINLNEGFLKEKSSVPDRVGPGNSLAVFYYIYKPNIACFGEDATASSCADLNQGYFSSFVGSLGGAFTSFSYLSSSSSRESLSGVFFAEIDEDLAGEKSNFIDGSIKFGNNEIQEKCLFIVPEKNFD